MKFAKTAASQHFAKLKFMPRKKAPWQKVQCKTFYIYIVM